MSRKRLAFSPIILLALIPIIGIGFFLYFSRSPKLLRGADGLLVTAVKYINGLDGKPVSSTADEILQVVGVMIDNHPDARPVSGLAKAKIVYEVPVEGGITRYLAIFDSKQVVAEVGPVRSARVYFLDWLQEYGDGLYLHSGGSPESLTAIKKRDIFDANEFFWGQYYWRSKNRPAPHNLYTGSDEWQKIVAQYGNTSSLFTADKAWQYARLPVASVANTSSLKITFNQYYEVSWEYNTTSLSYIRSRNGRIEKDKDGTEVGTKNILVQFTVVQDVANDDKGRQAITTVGSGDAIILNKGSVVYGTWKKESLSDRTRFYAEDGQEVTLVPGSTWVEVVPKEASVLVN